MTKFSMIDLSALSKPANTLIEKVSDAIGGIFKPRQIVRVAKAEAEANLIIADSQIKISEIEQRGMHRLIVEEGKKQENIESIVGKALPQLEPNSTPNLLESDWITYFFDKTKNISDDEMQNFWARILAGESNQPNTFSRRTINILSMIDKADAKSFTHLCQYVWKEDLPFPVIIYPTNKVYDEQKINFQTLHHLQDIGLVSHENPGFVNQNLEGIIEFRYFEKKAKIIFNQPGGNSLKLGDVIFTRAGEEIFEICKTQPDYKYFDFICKEWEKEQNVDSVAVS